MLPSTTTYRRYVDRLFTPTNARRKADPLSGRTVKSLQLAQGALAYTDEGQGPPLVFVHGLLVNSRIWDPLVAELLPRGFRCVRPEMPMGSHEIPLDPGADLSPSGVATLLGDFLTALDLNDATVIGNDSGGAVTQILAGRQPARVGPLVLTNCDIGETFPPFPFSLMPPVARLPGGLDALVAPMRLGPLRRRVYRPLTKVPIAPDLIDAWTAPVRSSAAIRRDTRKLITGVDKRQLVAADERLREFERPVLFAWGAEDRFFEPSLAAALASTMPDARVDLIANAKTFVMLDAPAELAGLIADFVTRGSGSPDQASDR